MLKNNKNYTISISLILILILNSITFINLFMFVGALDDAINDRAVEDAWDFPDNDGGYNHTLGTGIKVAIIDTGIDWQHPDFYRPDFSKLYDIGWNGTTYYIDFNENLLYDPMEAGFLNISNVYKGSVSYTGLGIDPNMDYGFHDFNLNNQYDYGEKICYYIDINNDGKINTTDKAVALNTGDCKIEIIRDYTTGKNVFKGVNLTNPLVNNEVDYDGHGTHLAGIVAGGWPKIRDIVGVAPNSSLLIYKVALWDPAGEQSNWDSKDTADAMYDAVNDGADVISLSYGEYFRNKTLDGSGFSEGGSILEDAIDWAYQQGVPVVVAAGNHGNKAVHTFNEVPKSLIAPAVGTFSIPFNIPAGPDGEDCMELEFLNVWKDPNKDIGVNVTIPNPFGIGSITIPDEFYDPTLPWDGNPHPFPVPPIFTLWVQREKYNANSNGVNKSYMKIWAEGWVLLPGAGLYTLLNYGNEDQEVHSYICSNYGWVISKWYCGSPGARWTALVDNFYTINSPATANHAIVVGSYITNDNQSGMVNQKGDISDFSSRGPRIDEIPQLDVIAPGEIILSTISRNVTNPYQFGIGNYTIKRGTSMAAPFVAGIIALAMDFDNSLKGNSTLIEQLIQDTAETDTFTDNYGAGYNDVTGYGKIDIIEILRVRSAGPSIPPLDLTLILIICAIIGALIVIVLVIWRKRKKPERVESAAEKDK